MLLSDDLVHLAIEGLVRKDLELQCWYSATCSNSSNLRTVVRPGLFH